MPEKVLVRVVRNLTDMRAGDTAWVDETETTSGMVAGGYWEIIGRKTVKRIQSAPAAAVKPPKAAVPEAVPEPVEEAAGGEDQAESA